LLSKLPDDTTQLLIDVCSGVGDLSSATLSSAVAAGANAITNGNSSHSRSPTSVSGIPYLSLLNYNRASVGDPGTTTHPKATAPDESVATEKPPDESVDGQLDTAEITTVSANELARPPRLSIPRPSQYFAHFVDHRTHFIRFLEAVANNRWGQRVQIDQG